MLTSYKTTEKRQNAEVLRRRERENEKALSAGRADELLSVRAFAKCRRLSVRVAFESLSESSLVERGATPGEAALQCLLWHCKPRRACTICGVRHFS